MLMIPLVIVTISRKDSMSRAMYRRCCLWVQAVDVGTDYLTADALA